MVRTNFVNEYAFHGDLTPDKMYWIGILATDGNVYINKNERKQNHVTLELCDFDVIKNFAKFVNSNYYRYVREDRPASKPTYIVKIVSDIMVCKLSELGITSNKSKSIVIPNSKIVNSWSFLRGCIEGDGSIYYRKDNSKWCICLASASKQFLIDIKNCKSEMYTNISQTGKTGNMLYTLNLSAKFVSYFARNLYYDSTPETRMQRKFEKAMKAIYNTPPD